MPGAAVGMFHGLHSPTVHEPSLMLPPTPLALQTQRESAPVHRPHIPIDAPTPTWPFNVDSIFFVEFDSRFTMWIEMIPIMTTSARPVISRAVFVFLIAITFQSIRGTFVRLPVLFLLFFLYFGSCID